MKTRLFLLTFLSLATLVSAQQNFILQSDQLSHQAFIENKGQFDGRNGRSEKILYAVDHGGIQVYFTDKGVSYGLFKTEKNYKRNKGEKGVPRMIVDMEMIHVLWENPSSSVEVLGLGLMDDYHTYPKKIGEKMYEDINNIRGYKKLLYKNIYPNIDLEYAFHPTTGLKYAFIVHPGGNPKQIALKVEGKQASIDTKGNLHIPTIFGDIIDHKPVSFFESAPGIPIETTYEMDGQSISFVVAEYDPTKKLIIDPWTVVPNAFSNSNKIWEIETDQNNNVYVYGGDSPMRLRKYSPAGALVWTYNTPWDTSNYWVGTLKTDLAGNSYITSGTSGTVRKINTSGTMEWNAANNGPAPEIEFWSLTFNCDYTKLYCGGMRASSGINIGSYRGTIFELSMANGTIVNYKNVGFNTGGFIPNIKEVRAVVYSPNQKVYYLTLDSIGGLDASFNQQYQTSSGFNFTYGIPAYGVTNQGIHAIAATADFLYTNNGNTLQKRNISNGAILASVAIPGGISNTVPFVGGNTPGNSGVVVDSCGNVYVGSANGVYKFSSNLTSLGSYTTPAAVYDVALNHAGEVVACGNNFIVSIATLSPCLPPPIVCLNCLEITPAGPFCHTDAPVNLTANNPGGVWSGPGITNASLGTFNPATAGVGTHVIRYTLNPALVCGADSVIIQVNNCSPLSVCVDGNGNFVVSGGTGPYSWQNQTTTQNCSGCILGCNFPPGCAVNTTTWTTFATGTSIPAPATYPIQVVSSNGTVYSIPNLASVPPCAACPTITVTPSGVTNISCFNGNNGGATVSASGGSTPYSYVWQPGNLSGTTQNNLGPGTYTVTATDANSCTGSTTITITQPSAALSLQTSSNPTNCGQSNGSASVAVSGGTPNYSYSWSPSGGSAATASNLSAGSYTVTVTDANGCTANAVVVVANANGPVISVSNQTNITCAGANNGSATIAISQGTAPYNTVWSPSGGSGLTASNLGAGVYTATVTDAGGCISTQTVTITEPQALQLTTSSLPANCGAADGSATVNVQGGTPNYSYSWSPSGGNASTASNLSAGSYTVTVTDNNNCTASATVNVSNTNGPVVTLDSQTDVTCANGNDGSATISVSQGTPPYATVWSPSGGTGLIGTNLSAGNYTATVTDASGCIALQTVVITEPPALQLSVSSVPATCGFADGSATVNVQGGTPNYSYSWSPSGGNAATTLGVATGNYTVTVTDAEGCQGTASVLVGVIVLDSTLAFTAVTTPESCDGNDGTATVTVTGGNPPYSYLWNGGFTPDSSFTAGLAAGTYNISITDACYTITGQVEVEQGYEVPSKVLYNIVTPNADGVNDVYSVGTQFSSADDFLCIIYNRWGVPVHKTTNKSIDWPAKVTDGTYFILVSYTDCNGKEEKLTGTITVAGSKVQ